MSSLNCLSICRSPPTLAHFCSGLRGDLCIATRIVHGNSSACLACKHFALTWPFSCKHATQALHKTHGMNMHTDLHQRCNASSSALAKSPAPAHFLG